MKKLSLFFISYIFFACNNSGDTKTEQVSDTASAVIAPSSTDHEFITAAAEGSLMEITLGRFASGHATDQRLKDYGYQMIADHEQLLDQLKQIAAGHELRLPDTVDAGHQQLVAYLEPIGGNIFDSTYMAEIIAHQKQLSGLYEQVMKTTADSHLHRYAAAAQPLIIQHLLRLITIKDSINIKKRK